MNQHLFYPNLYVTRYMGSKYRLLDFIVPHIEKNLPEDGTLIDVMAGTHAIGYALKNRNRVVANDIQFYSTVFGRALLTNNNVLELASRFSRDFENYDESLVTDSWFVRTYADTYFSVKQCIEIASIRRIIDLYVEESAKPLYLTVLANAMSLCQSSSGHFAQYFPKDHPRLKTLRAMSVFVEFKKRCMDISLEFAKHKNYVFQSNVMDFLSLGNLEKLAPAGSLVYFDPPYSTAQYSRYYHLLETVFLNDEPNVKHKGIYREDRHQSDFCSPRLVTTAFNEAISGYAQKGWNLVLSYSDSGLVKANQLLEICKTNYSKAEIHKRAFSHSTQGRGLVSKVDEIVIVCSDSKK